MAKKYNIPRGTFDILPENSFKWRFLQKRFRDIAETFNYREIVTPVFESADLFERSVGESSDIVEKEMYRFQDKKGRILALRPEGTASVARSYIENNLSLKSNASKLYYLGPMFRYDRPQKGRYRQFYQYGIENLGNADPFADAEAISLADMFLRKLGLESFELQINSIGCPNCSPVFDNALKEYFQPYINDLCDDCRRRIETKPKRILDCKQKKCRDISENAPVMLDYLDDDCRLHFEQLQKYLNLMEIPFIIDPQIVRGLDYYTQTAFEFVDNSLGSQNALIGGGRYSGLIKQLGGSDIPGIGFAGGFERLLLVLKTQNLSLGTQPDPDFFLITSGDKAKRAGISILKRIRDKGFSVDSAYEKHSLKAQMKTADKSGAKYALILGEEEMSNSRISLKNLETGAQKLLSLEILLKDLSKIQHFT